MLDCRHVIVCFAFSYLILTFITCRAERKLSQVCSEAEYRKVFERLQALPRHVEHLIVQLGALTISNDLHNFLAEFALSP